MASRFLHLRAGASAAARSALGRCLPDGLISAPPAMAPTVRALPDAASFAPALQSIRHYGTPSNHSITELIRAMRKVERRLDVLEEKSRDKPLVKEVSHEKEHRFHRNANVVMAVGYGFTACVILYYRFPWMTTEPRRTV